MPILMPIVMLIFLNTANIIQRHHEVYGITAEMNEILL